MNSLIYSSELNGHSQLEGERDTHHCKSLNLRNTSSQKGTFKSRQVVSLHTHIQLDTKGKSVPICQLPGGSLWKGHLSNNRFWCIQLSNMKHSIWPVPSKLILLTAWSVFLLHRIYLGSSLRYKKTQKRQETQKNNFVFINSTTTGFWLKEFCHQLTATRCLQDILVHKAHSFSVWQFIGSYWPKEWQSVVQFHNQVTCRFYTKHPKSKVKWNNRF